MDTTQILDKAFDRTEAPIQNKFLTKFPTRQEEEKTSTPKRGKDVLDKKALLNLRPKAERVMQRLLNSAAQTADLRLSAKLFEAVAPYILRKQPIGIDGGEGKPIQIDDMRSSIQAKLAKLGTIPAGSEN